MKEIWLPVVNFEGLYEVSSLGSVRNSRGRTLKAFYRNGYKRLELWKNKEMYRKSVHILVAEAFLSNDDNKTFVIHKDDDVINNVVGNLEWTCENKRNKKLTDKEIEIIRDIYIPRDAEFGGKALAEKFRVHRQTIYLVTRSKTKEDNL